MKIAIVSFYSGIYERGVERWVVEVTKRLSKNHKVVVYQNGSTNDTSEYEIVSLDIPFKKDKKELLFPLQKRVFLDYRGRRILFFALKLLAKLWKENFDVVIPTDGGWESALIRILTWMKRKKMVIVGHAGIGWDDRNNLWCFPDCFVALSTYAKDWAKKVNPLVKVKYIPDGIDVEKFKPGGKSLEVGLKKPIALCVSALEGGKRVDLVIKAVSRLKDVSLLVVGGGELKGELGELGKELLGDRFKISKYSFEKMPQVYRSSDIFLNASLPYYSFEMVLLEAMASGLSVVANNDPIRREIVGDAGICIGPVDVEGFAKAIRAGLKKGWGDRPRKQAERYCWNGVVKKYEKLFENLFG